MIRVKVSFPKMWLDHGHWPYHNHFPAPETSWGNYKFEINNEIDECDFWVVHESVDEKEKVKCHPKSVILITSEEQQQVPVYLPKYLNQFGTVVTSRADIAHPHTVRTAYICPWRVRKTYDEIAETSPMKTDTFSAIISNNISTQGHLKRYEFVKKLKEHFKDRMVWFGKGQHEIDDKWNGLAPYKYSLAIENCGVPFYFTEKIMDCYCASTMPIYWGCSNINDYFPATSMIHVNIDDHKLSIREIERSIEEGAYEKHRNAVLESKNLVLNRFQFVPALVNILKTLEVKHDNRETVTTILPAREFAKRSFAGRIFNSIFSKN